MPSFNLGNHNIFKIALGQFIPNCSPKHVITSTNFMIKNDLIHTTTFFVNKDLIDYSKQASLQKIQRKIMIDLKVAPEICAFASLFG